jgi:hypothetical protein
MLVLYDDGLPSLNYNELRTRALDYGIVLNSRKCHVNKKTVDTNDLALLNRKVSTKILLVTSKTINPNQLLGNLATYDGIVDAIGGNIGIVSISQYNLTRWSDICLHEILHLNGVQHCETKGCIMSFRLCQSTFKYCLGCLNPCSQMHICTKCKGDING